MIYGQSTQKSVEILKRKRADFLASQARLATSEPEAVIRRFRLMELDRAYADDPSGSVNCTCSTNPHQSSQGAFIAFPSDTARMLLCCADCGTIHYVGGEMTRNLDSKPRKSTDLMECEIVLHKYNTQYNAQIPKNKAQMIGRIWGLLETTRRDITDAYYNLPAQRDLGDEEPSARWAEATKIVHERTLKR